MATQNPYTPPSARVADVADSDLEAIESLNRIARGQRQVMFAVGANRSVGPCQGFAPNWSLVVDRGIHLFGCSAGAADVRSGHFGSVQGASLRCAHNTARQSIGIGGAEFSGIAATARWRVQDWLSRSKAS
jgi:hypothetical protein